MSGPWERFTPAAAVEEGPWSKFAPPPSDATSEPPAVPKQDVDLPTRAGMALNRTIAGVVGAPVDAATWAINKAGRGVQALTGEPRRDVITNPIGGSESIKKGISAVGDAIGVNTNPDSPTPATTLPQKIAEGIGEGVGMAVLPGLGAEAMLARSLSAADSIGTLALNILRGTGVASNAAMGAGGGAVGVALEEAVPETILGSKTAADAVRPFARMGGEIVGGGIGDALESGARYVARGARNIAEIPFRSAEEAAARQALAKVPIENREAFLTSLANTDTAPPATGPERPFGSDRFGDAPALEKPAPAPETPGNLTLFQATGDVAPKLGALERTAITKNPVTAMQVRQGQNKATLESLQARYDQEADVRAPADLLRARINEADAAQTDRVTAASQGVAAAFDRFADPNADPRAAIDFVRARLGELEANHAGRVAQAARDAADRLAAVGGATFDNPADYGEAMRAPLAALRQQAKREERALWAAVDPDGTATVNIGALKQAGVELEASIPRSAKPPAGEEDAILSTVQSLEDTVPFREVTALRGRLTDAIRRERRDGEPTVERRLTMMLRSVDDTLDSEVARVAADPAQRETLTERLASVTPEVVERYSAARQATRERAQTYDEGPIGAVLRPAGERGSYRMTASNVPRNLLERPENFRRFMETADPAARVAAEDYLAFDMRRFAVRDGLLSPQRLQQWSANNADALRAFPDVRARFANARTAQESLDAAIDRQAQALADAQTTAVSRFLTDADPVRSIGRAMESPESFTALANQVADDPVASAGLRRAVTDYMISKTATVENGVVTRVDPQKLEQFFGRHERSLAAVFGESGLAERFASVRRAQETFDAAIADGKTDQAARQTSAVKTFLADRDPHTALERVMKTPAASKALVDEVKTDPTALAGLKRLAVELILRKGAVAVQEGELVGAKEAGTSGLPQIALKAMQKFYINNRRGYAEIFDKSEMDNLNDVMVNIQKASRTEDAVRIPGQSNSPQDLWGIFKSGMSDVYRKAGSILGTTGGVYAAMADPFIGAPIAAGGIALDAWRTAYRNRMDAALADIMLDVRKAQIAIPKVVAKVEGKQAAIDDASAARKLRALLGQQLARELERTDDE